MHFLCTPAADVRELSRVARILTATGLGRRGSVAVVGAQGDGSGGGGAPRSLVGRAAPTVPGDDWSWVEPDYLSLLSEPE
jgi:hypothetical protein